MGAVAINDVKKQTIIRRKVIQWFEDHGRSFAWRNTTNPYHILIAEMLLRRTTATAVSKVYNSFLSQFNNPTRLAQTRESTIAHVISSLGLQSVRARQLKKTASIICKSYSGKVPISYAELISLPGVGVYIASAVRNFAFGESIPLVDGNVVYFISRVFGIKYRGPTDSDARDFMTHFGGEEQNAKLYWGIIDLVATVCFRRNSRCHICPLSELCTSSKTGDRINEDT
ncbi:MAG: hypothetical protein E3J86_11955 [Candidatus Thorarchaeota archaeon]|nr:MAG: hypothetical protein E3J86_11955 [Candidatus Thorarchaeota archaeon]